MKRILILMFPLTILFVVIFLTEKKDEPAREIFFWQTDIDQINYTKANNESKIASEGFTQSDWFAKKFHKDKNHQAFFTIHQIVDGIERSYEGGFALKNLFTEMMQLKVQSIEDAKPDRLDSLGFEIGKSPKLDFFLNGKIIQSIHLGKAGKDKRFVSAQNKILASPLFLFESLKGNPIQLRERQIVNPGTANIKFLEYKFDERTITLHKWVYKNNDQNMTMWKKNTPLGLVEINNGLGDQLENRLKAIKFEIFPDEPNGQGFAVADALAMDAEQKWIILKLSNGMELALKIYPMTVIQEKKYRLVKREYKGLLQESPAYIKQEELTLLDEAAEAIATAGKKK